MRLKYIIKIFSFLLLFSIEFFAQISGGAKSISLSNSNIISFNDVFSVFFNPAALSTSKNILFGAYYSPSPFGLKELSTANAAFVYPMDEFSVGLGFEKYGFELLNEKKIVVSVSNMVDTNIIAGISLTYQNIHIENYGDDSAFSLNFGTLFIIEKWLSTGFSVTNLLRSSYGSETGQIPFTYSFGVKVSPISFTDIYLSIFKEDNYPISFRFGIEYPLIKYLTLRTGFMNDPQSISGGIGLYYSFINFDYAVFTHSVLGLTHQAAIILSVTELLNY